MIVCPLCQTENPLGSRFCNGCGSRLEAAASTGHPGDERKVITALFCDLVGSTELADRLDPEDVDRLLRAYHAIARRRIQAYGGSVEKFIGDAVVGVFGVPSAHEDDPERALRAALRLIEELRTSGLDLHVRIGICTGETLVRTDANPDAGEAFATGDTLNIAARLQSSAPIDGIAVAESTHRACHRLFRWNDLGELPLKGRAEPMHAWQPLEAVARSTGELIEETTPFVGRETELDVLVRAFDRSRNGPGLEVVTIVAEPGTGKSRLVREMRRHLEGLPELVRWRSGRCLPYGDGIGFWALGEIVAAEAGILETDDQATLSAKLDAVLIDHDPRLRGWLKDRLGPLVGLDVAALSPQEDETFAAWRRFLEGIAHTGPLVLVIEDLHWADAGFVRFLEHLADSATAMPILLVVTTRPEIADRHPTWPAQAHGSTVLSLTALPDGSISELLHAALPEATSELLAAIVDRAEGSPLYAEQFAAMLRDGGEASTTGVDWSTVPPTVQALLAARIDALPSHLKPVLLDASVVGRTFWSGTVASLEDRAVDVVEPELADLARREFARPSLPSTFDGEAEYAFWHALVRDVAYGALTRSARVAKHRASAIWITERSGGVRGRTAEIIAEHYARALEYATALGSTADLPGLRDAYVDALVGAAQHAQRTSPPQAAMHARHALDLIEREDPRQLEIQLTLARASLDAGEYRAAREAYEVARALLLARGGVVDAASIAVRLSTALAESGDAARAAVVLTEARDALAATPGPELLEVMAAQAMAIVRASGDRVEAAESAQRIVALADRLGLEPPARALMALGGDANWVRAIQSADRAGDLRLGSRCRSNRAIHYRGPADAWLRVIEDAVEFDRIHGIGNLPITYAKAEFTFLYLGRAMHQTEELESIIDRAEAVGDRFTSSLARSSLLEIHAIRGEPVDDLDELLDGWEAAGLGGGTEWFRAETAFLAGDLDTTRSMLAAYLDDEQVPEKPWTFVDRCLAVGDRALAERSVSVRAMALEAEAHTDADAVVLDAAIDAAITGRLAEDAGDLAIATDAYERALATFEPFGWDMLTGLIRLWLGRTLISAGDAESGAASLTTARGVGETLGLAPWLTEIDRLTNVAPAGSGPDRSNRR